MFKYQFFYEHNIQRGKIENSKTYTGLNPNELPFNLYNSKLGEFETFTTLSIIVFFKDVILVCTLFYRCDV